ncbi:hypothetical protein CH63R_07738 [Colletotrichum higginsianum IMI 349063]|uniref:Uncharacterized protein n=1 Tax=Colletotrichum higginsianum (strain IMI 349063) TaxID=759273 RepID=A0A1B7YA58_COLHI|nr:hypothetical protein CH63R_07738 [Colletotrichum higginsianum IMI 349063]OBR08973.1 hypothetical protein CH63R_07738 [Colletotrichum higginsianum IMI 349063]
MHSSETPAAWLTRVNISEAENLFRQWLTAEGKHPALPKVVGVVNHTEPAASFPGTKREQEMEGEKRFEAASSRNTRGCAVVLYDPVAWVAWDKHPLFARAPRPRPSKGLDGICTGRAPRKYQSKPACEKIEMISDGREVMKIEDLNLSPLLMLLLRHSIGRTGSLQPPTNGGGNPPSGGGSSWPVQVSRRVSRGDAIQYSRGEGRLRAVSGRRCVRPWPVDTGDGGQGRRTTDGSHTSGR